MSYSEDNLNEFTDRVKRLVADLPNNEFKQTPIPDILVYKGTDCTHKQPTVYEPAILIMAQGKKRGMIGEHSFDISVGRYLSVFLPIAWEVEVLEASQEKPLIMSGFKMDLGRIANILMRMDRVATDQPNTGLTAPSSVYSEPLTDPILDTLNRLLKTADNPLEREVLGESLMDELYFRLICNDHSGSLPQLLHHRGQIPQIAKAVTHIHNNLDEVVSVNHLANMVNMSPSGFRKAFRDVMHMPPLQYAKSIKLDRAQLFIRQGLNASEAGYKVGYNSASQFSREYKRHFGFAPSDTRV